MSGSSYKRVQGFTGLVTVLAVMAVNPIASAETPDVSAGRRIAEQNCGGCHATGAESSPLADAPPFRQLYLRYPAEGLGWLLQEGMIAPQEPRDEAPQVFHPRMPIVDLDVGQVSELRAYLQSLEPPALKGR
jgi:cytochrome c